MEWAWLSDLIAKIDFPTAQKECREVGIAYTNGRVNRNVCRG